MVYYRYEVSRYYDGRFAINLYTFPVVRKTLKGVWIKLCYGMKDKFILNDARKRWAYPTKELAWNSFRIRAFRRKEHLENQLNFANRVYSEVQNKLDPPTHAEHYVYKEDHNDFY